jgi:hypothetical protein
MILKFLVSDASIEQLAIYIFFNLSIMLTLRVMMELNVLVQSQYFCQMLQGERCRYF